MTQLSNIIAVKGQGEFITGGLDSSCDYFLFLDFYLVCLSKFVYICFYSTS